MSRPRCRSPVDVFKNDFANCFWYITHTGKPLSTFLDLTIRGLLIQCELDATLWCFFKQTPKQPTV